MTRLALAVLAASTLLSSTLSAGSLVRLAPAPDVGPRQLSPTHGRIVGGTPSGQGTWPFQAYLEISTSGGTFSCGGSLISPNFVLTAAHCLTNIGPNITVNGILVAVNRAVLSDGANGLVLNASAFVTHPGFGSGTDFNNDIAIVQLATPATGVPTVSIIADATQDDAGVNGRVIGYGATSEGGEASSTLLEVCLPILSDDAPAAVYGSDFIAANMLGAGIPPGGKDSCQGDSGGPFLVPNGSSVVQAGIVSFGFGCAREGVPGVYTRLANYSSWVSSITGVQPGTGTFTTSTAAACSSDFIGEITIKKQKKGKITGFVEGVEDFVKERPSVFFNLTVEVDGPNGPELLETGFQEVTKAGKISKKGRAKFTIKGLKGLDPTPDNVALYATFDDGASYTPLISEPYEASP